MSIESAVEGNRPYVILIDGRSGAGKTTLAERLAQAMPARPTVVHLDALYPGWGGLDAGSAMVCRMLAALADGRDGAWRRWDWTTNTEDEWHVVRSDRPVIVEGAGAISRESRKLAQLAIWAELELERADHRAAASERRRRAIGRDGEMYEPHWEEWAAQERRFHAREGSRDLADLIVDVDRLFGG